MAHIDAYLNITINVFALAVLTIIFFNMRRHAQTLSTDSKLFGLFIFFNALIMALDIIMYLLGGQPGSFVHIACSVVGVLYFILNPAMCVMWYFYVDYHIIRDEVRLKKLTPILLIPAFAIAALSVLSYANGFLFYYDAQNIYHRGPGFIYVCLCALFYVLYSVAFILRNCKKVARREYITLLLFLLPPTAGGALQTIFYGFSLVWPCVALSILIVFINIQNNQLYRDYLTGVYNRRQLDHYLKFPISQDAGFKLAGIMLDLNSFKMINDCYGHSAGDDALQHTAGILKRTFRKNDFIARYGGDEFIVLATVRDKDDLQRAIGRLRASVDSFNSLSSLPYDINLSLGFDVYDSDAYPSVQAFISHLDSLMYKDKQYYANQRD